VGSRRILLVDDNQVLVALLARMLESEGLVPVLALRGRAALEKIAVERPDAAVVDVLLPDMMGYEVGAALRKAGIPFVFMTGIFKGSRAASEARSQHGAADYFEKPFDAKKLVQALRALLPPSEAEAPEPVRADELVDFELEVAVEPEERVDPMELTGRVEVVEGGKVQAIISGQPLQAASIEPVAPRARPAAEPAPRTPATAPPPGGDGAAEGPLQDNLPELITAFWLAQQTGELVLQKGKVRKVVWFEKGRPVFASSNLVSDRFGPFLQRVGKITAAQLAAAQVLDRPNRMVGDAFEELGYLKEQEKIYYLAQQVKAIAYSVFGWEEGRYRLVAGRSAPSNATHVEIHPAHLIARGVKKLYKSDRLKRLLRPDDRLAPTQQPAYGLHDVVLEIWEAQLLPLANGSRTVAELAFMAGRPEPEVLGFLWSLVALQILERAA